MHVAVTRIDVFAGAVSFCVALFSIAVLMNWLRRATFTPFVVYRLVVSATVVVLAYGWVRF
jgi:undecaprenyl-diphosphatase